MIDANRKSLEYLSLFTQVTYTPNNFPKISCFLEEVTCVRWNLNGDSLASSSCDNTANLLNFKTWKAIPYGTTADGGNSRHLNSPDSTTHLEWAMSVCLI